MYMMADSGCAGLRGPDPSAGSYAWPDGQAGRLDHQTPSPRTSVKA